jgi:hypothetical protein
VHDHRAERSGGKEVTVNASTHIVRNVVATALVLGGLIVVAAVINGALGTMVMLIELGLVLAVLPFVVIHYDEHDERLRYRRPG